MWQFVKVFFFTVGDDENGWYDYRRDEAINTHTIIIKI